MANELGAAPQGQVRRGWEQLPHNLIQRIFQRLGPDDYFTACDVCMGWFAAAMEDPAVNQLPMLLFPMGRPGQVTRLHSLANHRRYEMLTTELNAAMCRGATCGWLLFEERGGIVCIINLLHGTQFYLPTHKKRDMSPLRHLVNCTPAQRRYRYPTFTMAILSSAPTEPDCAFAGVVGKNRLVMCRLFDLKWVLVADYEDEEGYIDMVHHCQCFYVLDAYNNLTVFDAAPNPNVRRIEAATSCAEYNDPPAVEKYLVESLGELLLVENTLDLWNIPEPVSGPANYTRIFKLDKCRPRWIPVLVDAQWSCSEAHLAGVDEDSERTESHDDVGDSDGEAMPLDVEVDSTVRGRVLVLGRGTSLSLASDGFPDVALDLFNREVMYTLSTSETTLILPKRRCDRYSAPIWVTPNPQP